MGQRKSNRLLPLVFGLTLVFAYNSCQQFKAINMNVSSQSATCRRMVENGQRKVVRDEFIPEAFRNQKVRLGEDTEIAGYARAQKSNLGIAKGKKLSILLDNTCVNQLATPSGFINAILNGSKPHPMLDRQAYSYTVAEDTSQAELEAAAYGEPCVIGISWEHKYKLQSVAFNDSGVSMQSHLAAINAIQAHQKIYADSTGIPRTGGTPVKIAILDTGVDTLHPDLNANLWKHSLGVGVDITTLAGTVSYLPSDLSSIGHGTHVAGIIGAVSNNGVGIMGTMPYNASLMVLKIFEGSGDDISTTTTHFSNGMQVAHLNGASVINLSIESSGTSYDVVAQSMLQSAINKGISVAVAMGNESPGKLVDGSTVRIVPAVYSAMSGVMGVASFNSSTGALSTFSNYSTTYAEIAAPGAVTDSQGIYSTIPTSQNSYGNLRGTSQATPIVAAAAGMVHAWVTKATGHPPTPTEVENLILSSAAKSSALVNYVKSGNKLDLLALANKIQSVYPGTGGSTPTPTPSPNPGPCD